MKKIFDVISGIDDTASNTIAAGATTVLYTLQVPYTCKFLLTHFANYVGAVSAWSNIVWNVKANGVPVTRLNNIKDQIGTQIEPRELGEDIIIMSGASLTFEATNNGSISFDVGISFKGEYVR